MTPLRIRGGQTFAGEGCTDLQVRVSGNVFESLWEPTPGEIKLLLNGGRVVLSILGYQPPVKLTVEPAP